MGLGNGGMWGGTVARRACFNEAEARGPRKWKWSQMTTEQRAHASMRPRPVGLGNGSSIGKSAFFSIGFNEAEARGPRKWVWMKRWLPTKTPLQ